ncbi:hypothetical protein V5F38_04170 [Xanthobacter sp. V0B-10]|uniref:hypothetical protein n=1 Tax=Xanthobacter albus TaxID=3119929 RepID=UPI003728B39F
MPLPRRDFVEQVLLEKGRAARIHEAVRSAWVGANDAYPQRARWRRKSTFRGLVWEDAVRELSLLSVDDPDFKYVEHRDTASFIINDAVLFRFKHADVSLTTANFPTPEAEQFDDHDIDLYGYAGLQRVELCYVLNEFETDVIWVGVAARHKGVHLWKIELNDAGVVVPSAELPLIEPEADPAKLAKIKAPGQQTVEKKTKDSGGT